MEDSILPSMIADVERFQRQVLDYPVPSKPLLLSNDARHLKMMHLLEEIKEFDEAKTAEELADAFLDIAYVALGGLVQMGICVGAAFEEVHAANMRRELKKGPDRAGGLAPDATKPEDWRPPEWEGLLCVTMTEVKQLSRSRRRHPSRPKILVIGYARHGKDTVCEHIRDQYNFKFRSSSEFLAERLIMPALVDKYIYETAEQCFQDRSEHRAEWFQLIDEFNRPDATTLARAILEENDIYCGMRSSRELHACLNMGIFDHVIWVDASERMPKEPRSSCTVEPWMADFVVDANGSLDDTLYNVRQLMDRLYV